MGGRAGFPAIKLPYWEHGEGEAFAYWRLMEYLLESRGRWFGQG